MVVVFWIPTVRKNPNYLYIYIIYIYIYILYTHLSMVRRFETPCDVFWCSSNPVKSDKSSFLMVKSPFCMVNDPPYHLQSPLWKPPPQRGAPGAAPALWPSAAANGRCRAPPPGPEGAPKPAAANLWGVPSMGNPEARWMVKRRENPIWKNAW